MPAVRHRPQQKLLHARHVAKPLADIIIYHLCDQTVHDHERCAPPRRAGRLARHEIHDSRWVRAIKDRGGQQSGMSGDQGDIGKRAAAGEISI